jgi:putative membrane protein
MLLNTQIPFRYIFNKIKTELIYVFIIVLLVYYITLKYIHLIPEVPLAIPTFLGTAISIILSFKLNQSYDRWWEARKVWGTIVNESRNLVLQLQSFVAPGNEGAIKTIALRHIGWGYSLGRSLRQMDATRHLEQFIDRHELIEIRKHSNTPLALLQKNSQDIMALRNKGAMEIYSHIQINNTIVSITNAMGMAERIKSTIFPITYRVFLHGAIYLYIVTLSIALRGLESYFEVPLLVIIASFFFLLERTATHLQDPFSNKPTDTPVTAIARTVEINIKQLLNEPNVPEPIAPEKYYIM